MLLIYINLCITLYLTKTRESEMLYSIGYTGLTVEDLINILQAYKVTHLIDVRSKPFSRDKAFNKSALQRALANESVGYLWKGGDLGGLGEITDNNLTWLKQFQSDKVACVMCMESDPIKCHRYYEIGKRLNRLDVVVKHIKVVTTPRLKFWIMGEEGQETLL